MDVIALLNVCKAQDIRLTVAKGTLHCDAPTGALTEEVREAIAQHKGELLSLLSPVTSPPTGETAAAAAPPTTCTHAATYRRPSGVQVCLDCGQAQVPGNPTWHRQHPRYCDEGQHVPYADMPADQPRQCMKCPYVWDTPAAARPLHPAVHDPHCPGNGLVVVPSWGWSCPQCNGRYVVPEAPASSAPAHQAALPLASSVPHGEAVPSKRRR